MVQPGDVLEAPRLGVRMEIRMTGEQTDGAFFEFDVVGRARGFLRQAHVHSRQSERLEVIEGALQVNDRRLGPGEAIEVPPGAPHTQNPAGPRSGRGRITHRPAGRTGAFLERLAALDVNRFGSPRPRAAAEFLRDFGDEGHALRPPLRVQRALAQMILCEYAFVDEWDVAAPPEAVWDTLADA